MARVTVEDCLDNVDNRFELVLVATKRARQLANGKEAQLPWENDKPTVLALREIAAGLVNPRAMDEAAAREAMEAAALEEAAALAAAEAAVSGASEEGPKDEA